jgi:hypothetical protein
MFSGRNPTVHLIHPESKQLFLIFTGNAERLMMDPLRFLQVTGIVSSNILIFRDPYKAGYQTGISSEYASLDAMVEYIRHEIWRLFTHVSEVFCVGTSSGGLPALYCGHLLDVRAVWCFGGRVCKQSIVAERDAEIRALERRSLGRDPPPVIGDKSFTASEMALIRETVSRPDMQQRFWHLNDDPENVLDHAMLGKVVNLKSDCRNNTMLHLYYSPRNEADSFVAHSFEGLANVSLHPVDSPPGSTSIALTGGSTHVVAKLLDDQGRLGEVFRDYLQLGSAKNSSGHESRG